MEVLNEKNQGCQSRERERGAAESCRRKEEEEEREERQEQVETMKEGGVESDEPSFVIKLSISSGPRRTDSPQQLLRVDTAAALPQLQGRQVFPLSSL